MRCSGFAVTVPIGRDPLPIHLRYKYIEKCF
jgi:hypothetical protein